MSTAVFPNDSKEAAPLRVTIRSSQSQKLFNASLRGGVEGAEVSMRKIQDKKTQQFAASPPPAGGNWGVIAILPLTNEFWLVAPLGLVSLLSLTAPFTFSIRNNNQASGRLHTGDL